MPRIKSPLAVVTENDRLWIVAVCDSVACCASSKLPLPLSAWLSTCVSPIVMPIVALLELAAVPAMPDVEEKKINENMTPKIAT